MRYSDARGIARYEHDQECDLRGGGANLALGADSAAPIKRRLRRPPTRHLAAGAAEILHAVVDLTYAQAVTRAKRRMVAHRRPIGVAVRRTWRDGPGDGIRADVVISDGARVARPGSVLVFRAWAWVDIDALETHALAYMPGDNAPRAGSRRRRGVAGARAPPRAALAHDSSRLSARRIYAGTHALRARAPFEAINEFGGRQAQPACEPHQRCQTRLAYAALVARQVSGAKAGARRELGSREAGALALCPKHLAEAGRVCHPLKRTGGPPHARRVRGHHGPCAACCEPISSPAAAVLRNALASRWRPTLRPPFRGLRTPT